jgi:uncharacterized protein YjiS (DUF1127 family)
MSPIQILYRHESASAGAREISREPFHRAIRSLCCWFDRIAQRAALSELEDHLLRDIGRTRAQVEAEIRKPFWRA